MEDPTHASELAQAPAAEKAVVLTRTVIEPDTEALLEAPLRIEIEVRASKAITNARWEATVRRIRPKSIVSQQRCPL